MKLKKITLFLIILCILFWFSNTWDVYKYIELLFILLTKNFIRIVKFIVLFVLFFITIKDKSLSDSYRYHFGKFFYFYPKVWKRTCFELKKSRLGRKILLKLLIIYLINYNFYKCSEEPEYPNKMFYLKFIVLFVWILICIKV